MTQVCSFHELLNSKSLGCWARRVELGGKWCGPPSRWIVEGVPKTDRVMRNAVIKAQLIHTTLKTYKVAVWQPSHGALCPSNGHGQALMRPFVHQATLLRRHMPIGRHWHTHLQPPAGPSAATG